MASTTFNGPVRSEKGFQVATKNATTGAVTTRMSSGMPDLTGLSKADVATASSLTLAADTISICLLYTSPSPRDQRGSRMPSSA